MPRIKCTKCGEGKLTRKDRLEAMSDADKNAYLCRGCRKTPVSASSETASPEPSEA